MTLPADITCHHCGKRVANVSLARLAQAQAPCPECGRTLQPFNNETILVGRPLPPPLRRQVEIQLPGYEMLRQIGEGGMGVVFEARQLSLDRKVAVKLIPPELARQPDFLARFEREATLLAKLSHPNIVAIYERGHAGDQPYIIMEYVEGADDGRPRDLRQLAQSRALGHDDVRRIALEVGGALAHAHGMGIVHRDVKPSNVLIDRFGRAKLTDFGIAVVSEANSRQLTCDRAAMGTPHYMAPEQQAGAASIDGRADVYALGVVLYELLTGTLPQGAFEPPSRASNCDSAWDEIVLRALRPQREQRWNDMNELVRAVESTGLNALTPIPIAAVVPGGTESCTSCAGTASRHEQFCRHCGDALWLSCPSCETRSWMADRFCLQCGLDLHKRSGFDKLLATAQRSLAAAQVAGDLTARLASAEEASIAVTKALKLQPSDENARRRLKEANQLLAQLLLQDGNQAYEGRRLGHALTQYERLQDLGCSKEQLVKRIEKIRAFREESLAKIRQANSTGHAESARNVLHQVQAAFADDEEVCQLANQAQSRLSTLDSAVQVVPQLVREGRLFAARTKLAELRSAGTTPFELARHHTEIERRIAEADGQLRHAQQLLESRQYAAASSMAQTVAGAISDHPAAAEIIRNAFDKQAELERQRHSPHVVLSGTLPHVGGQLEAAPVVVPRRPIATAVPVEAVPQTAASDVYLKLPAFAAAGGLLVGLSGILAQLLYAGMDPLFPRSSILFGLVSPALVRDVVQLLLQPLLALTILWLASLLMITKVRSKPAMVFSVALVVMPVGLILATHLAIGVVDELAVKFKAAADSSLLSYWKSGMAHAVMIGFLWASIAVYSLILVQTVGISWRGLERQTLYGALLLGALRWFETSTRDYSPRLIATTIVCGLLPLIFIRTSWMRFICFSTACLLDAVIRHGAMKSGAEWYEDFDWGLTAILMGCAAALSTRPISKAAGVVGFGLALLGLGIESSTREIKSLPSLPVLAAVWAMAVGAAATVGRDELDRGRNRNPAVVPR